MLELSAEGHRIVADMAARHGVGAATVQALLAALAAGGGSQAQFNIAELGGMGQWSRGGMVMVGDMFNNALKARVDALCTELAVLLATSGAFAASQTQTQGQGGAPVSLFVRGSGGAGAWWPAELGRPASTGAQNDMRYAFFSAAQRLAIDLAGRVTVYDTGDHQLTGFSQQQSGDRSLTFTSQHGLVRVADLPVAPGGGSPAPAPTLRPPAAPAPPSQGADDVFVKIERLADLRARGIITDQEFEAKKSELMSRL